MVLSLGKTTAESFNQLIIGWSQECTVHKRLIWQRHTERENTGSAESFSPLFSLHSYTVWEVFPTLPNTDQPYLYRNFIWRKRLSQIRIGFASVCPVQVVVERSGGELVAEVQKHDPNANDNTWPSWHKPAKLVIVFKVVETTTTTAVMDFTQTAVF